jgi:hypothetical protein
MRGLNGPPDARARFEGAVDCLARALNKCERDAGRERDVSKGPPETAGVSVMSVIASETQQRQTHDQTVALSNVQIERTLPDFLCGDRMGTIRYARW